MLQDLKKYAFSRRGPAILCLVGGLYAGFNRRSACFIAGDSNNENGSPSSSQTAAKSSSRASCCAFDMVWNAIVSWLGVGCLPSLTLLAAYS